MFKKGLEQLCRLSQSGLLITGLSKIGRSVDEGIIVPGKMMSVSRCYTWLEDWSGMDTQLRCS